MEDERKKALHEIMYNRDKPIKRYTIDEDLCPNCGTPYEGIGRANMCACEVAAYVAKRDAEEAQWRKESTWALENVSHITPENVYECRPYWIMLYDIAHKEQ